MNTPMKLFQYQTMTKNQQLNTISGFCILLIIIMIIFNNNNYWLYSLLIISIFVTIIYNFLEKKQESFDNINLIRDKNHSFINPDLMSLEKQDIPVAFNADDYDINEKIKVFRDWNDLLKRNNSQRNFSTLFNTVIPNQQKEFANWLYKLPDSAICKVDGSSPNCLRYEDLRLHFAINNI